MEQQGQSSSTHPARGRRYSPAQRAEILKDAEEMGVAKAAEKHGCAPWTIYDWRHKAARRGTESLPSGNPTKRGEDERMNATS